MMRTPILLLLPALLAPVFAHAAVLRPLTELRGPVVRLSDLFDDLAAPDRPLGTSPPPGSRLMVEAAQLAAIARQFSVAWKPASNADRVVLERAGRPLPRAAALAAMRPALIAAGADEDCEIVLDGFAAPMVPVEGLAEPLVSQLAFNRDSGKFTATLSIAGAGMDRVHIRVTGRADAMQLLPVATARLAASTVLRDEDLRMARVRSSLVREDVVESPAEAVGKEIRHQIQPGQPIRRGELAQPALVLKGRAVRMTLQTPGLILIGEGQALESAGLGEPVKVLNTASHAVLQGIVTGAGHVRVDPESAPLVPPGRNSGRAFGR